MAEHRMKRMKKTAAAGTVMLVAIGMLCSVAASQSRKRPAEEECKRCHDVATYQRELQSSVHAVDKDKKNITCDQCHQFHFNPVTAYYARDEYYDKKIFQPGDFDRRRLQKNARRAIQPEKCQACHKDLSKNVKNDPISEIGHLCHDAYLGKNGSTTKNCAGCHVNIAHLPGFDRDLTINAAFLARLLAAEKTGGDKGGLKK